MYWRETPEGKKGGRGIRQKMLDYDADPTISPSTQLGGPEQKPPLEEPALGGNGLGLCSLALFGPRPGAALGRA